MEAIGNIPTAADYARADIEAANRSLTSLGASLREACERAELAEEKLKYITYIEQALDGAATLVEAELVRKDLKAVLEAETMEDLRKLREQE